MASRFRRSHGHIDDEIPLTPINETATHQIGNGLAAPLSGTPLFGHYTNDYAEVFNEISRLDQNANPPIFIPSLVELRRKCFDHVSSSLLQLEREMQSMHQDKDKVDRAIGLLRDMDTMVESEAKRLRLEDPEYAASRGLSIVHFEPKNQAAATRRGNWLMLSKKWGHSTSNIVEPVDVNKRHERVLSKYHLEQIQAFMGADLLDLHTWTRRTKTAEERQKGSLRYQVSGETELRYRVARAWKLTLYLAVAALVCFYGVGIIATNSEFSPTFEQYFFWIAIFWSLISSSLLSWVVKVLGGTHRDVVAAMLTGIGIWLVVIQIGQTRLNRQLEDKGSPGTQSS